MIELIPVAIDTITASIGLADKVKGKKENPTKVKTQINNYHITVNQNSDVEAEPVAKPKASTKPRGTELRNDEMLVIIIVAFVAMVATVRFYCHWEQYINAFFSLIILVASLCYQAVASRYIFDKKTQVKHFLLFAYPVLFHLSSLIVGYFIGINATFEQYRAADTFGASIKVWFNSVNPTSVMIYVLVQLLFILSVLFGLVMLTLEIYITCSTKKRSRWLTDFFEKYDISSVAIPICFLILLISLIFYPFLQKSA